MFNSKVNIFFSATFYIDKKHITYNNVVVCSRFPSMNNLKDHIKTEYPKAEDIFILGVSKLTNKEVTLFNVNNASN